MTLVNRLNDYINEIPWDNSPIKININLDVLKSSFNFMLKSPNDIKNKIRFDDDRWNFNGYFKDVNNQNVIYLFHDFPYEIKNLMKFFVLFNILINKKLSTLNIVCRNFRSVVNEIKKKTNKSFFVFSNTDYDNEIRKRNNSHSSMHNLYWSVSTVCSFLKNECNLKLGIDIKKLDENAAKEKRLSKIILNKIPNIDDRYFTIIIQKMTDIMKNNNLKLNDRIIAAMTILLSQTGLRINDLMCLKVYGFKKIYVHAVKDYWYILEYETKKPSKPYKPVEKSFTIVTTAAKDAIEYLMHFKEQLCNTNEYLFVLKDTLKIRHVYPIPAHIFILRYKKLFVRHLFDEASLDWPGVQKTKVFLKPTIKTKKNIKVLSIPETRQYRVHFCTQLFNIGFPIEWIRKYMGHLSPEMDAYYYNPTFNYQENNKYTEKVIFDIAQKNYTPIGLYGQELQEKIKKFILDNNFNIYKDLSAIIEKLGNNLSIRPKNGGVCIKTSLIPCHKDKRTDPVNCAMNLCPNQYYFFYMCNGSYITFKEMINLYYFSKKNNHVIDAKHCKNQIDNFCKKKLLPELQQLDEQIKINGVEKILMEYPNLNEIIKNEKKIKEEISAWIKN